MKEEYKLKDLKKRPGKAKVIPDANKISVTLRLDANDLSDFKAEAERQGIPYQTLIGSLVHLYVKGDLIDKQEALNLRFG